MAAELKFVDSHNILGYLMDPPPAHQEFKSMSAGLNSCRISHALRANPVICKDMIIDFWRNVTYTTSGANGAGTLESTVRGVKVVVTEQIVREVLEFGDTANSPTEYPADQVKEVLNMMSYEGLFPPTMKKLLPPYWRFLAHTFVSCISGRKGGADEISQTVSTAIVALAMNWDYNFSKYVFEEMRSNIEGKKKDLFLMFPRFLQMILDDRYPQIEKTTDTLDVKSLGPSTFGLMKQQRVKAKIAYKGLKKLEKFGKFAEIEGVQEAPVINAEVVEEHVAPLSKFPIAVEEINDSDDDEETEEEEDVSVIDTMTKEELNAAIQQIIPTTEQIEAAKAQSQLIELNPPQSISATISESAAESEEETPDTGLTPRKRRKRDPGPSVWIREPTQETSTPVESVPMTQVVQESPITEPTPMAQDDPRPIFEESSLFGEDIFVEETQAAGSSAVVKGKHKLPGSEPIDIEGLQRRVFELEQSSTEKDFLIGKLDVRVSDLEKSNSEKDKKISELQANLGGLTAMFYDLKQRLVRKYGDEFKTAIDESRSVPTTSPSSSTPTATPSSAAPATTHSEPRVI